MTHWPSFRIGSAPLILVLLTTSILRAANFADLKSDWSNTSNPNPGASGTWAYTQGGTPLAPISHWAGDSNQSGWGPAANVSGNFLPFFFKTPVVYGDSLPGDVIIHTTDTFNGNGNGPAVLIWTSAVSGDFIVNGSLWPTRLIGRLNEYQLTLTHNGTPAVLDSGQIVEDGSISRCHPIRIKIPVTLAAGDVLQLLLDRLSMPGDFAGVSLSVSTGSCPNSAGDLNGDGHADGLDIAHFVNCLLNRSSPCADCACSDLNGDGMTTLEDMPAFVASLL